MEEYHNILKKVIEHGKDRKDRTGVGTKSIFGMQARFNLQESFPAVTTKKLAWKSVVSELYWFLEASTDERRLAEIHFNKPRSELTGKTTIWTANADVQGKEVGRYPGDLNNVYGYQWRKWSTYENWEEHVTLIKQVHDNSKNEDFYIDFPLEIPVTSNDDLVGKIFTNIQNEQFIVLENIKGGQYRVQFLTGTRTVVQVSYSNLVQRQVKNPYSLDIANNNGCLGKPNKTIFYYKKAYSLWKNIMLRCYSSPCITDHKANDVFVNKNWKCFEIFLKEIATLPGFDLWIHNPNEYVLDIDYFGANYYGLKTTIFLPRKYNKKIHNDISANSGNLIIAKNKQTGQVFKFVACDLFYKKFNIRDKNLINAALSENNGQSKNWTFEVISPPQGFKWRQRFFVDQISELIENLKTNSDSRRHILSAWNVKDISNMALPPCHTIAQFYVYDNELSCHLYQRSADLPLGSPFNIASYALLTHILAKLCNYKVGEFVYSIGDAHIYHNQIDGVKEQLNRESLPGPQLVMPDFNSLDEMLKLPVSSFKLEGYSHHPEIKFPFAV